VSPRACEDGGAGGRDAFLDRRRAARFVIRRSRGPLRPHRAAPGISWTSSDAAATSLSFAGAQGYLATLTSPEENAFVTSLLPFISDTGAYLGGIQLDSSGANDQGWAWVTGEPWGYTNWAFGEPNNLDEMYLRMWLDGYAPYRARRSWNDGTDSGELISGFVVEFDAVPEPAGSAWLALGLAALLRVTRRQR
jgi:hypothetical protein